MSLLNLPPGEGEEETDELIEDKKKFTGILEIINDDSVVVAVDGKMVEIKDHAISKATLAG